jgi:Fe-S oxidoreductase/nitrate reductase gamma subunit
MLTLAEKILFIACVILSFLLAYRTFGKMWRIIQRGQGGKITFDQMQSRLTKAIGALFTQGRIIRHRRATSLFHYGVAFGFIYYLLVNLIDVIEGFVPGFRFLGDTAIGGLYRLLADVLSVAVLVGVIYFIVRRFFIKPNELQFNPNVKLHPKVKRGIQRDSLIVAVFILLHVGFRFIGASIQLAQDGSDMWQPFASALSALWRELNASELAIGRHVAWWLALGLILAFLPYFPYTKHLHLFAGPFNFATRPERAALGAMEKIDFDDQTIEKFGAAKLTDLHQKHVVDAFACIMCNRCQQVCPAYTTGKELSPSALEVNKRYYIWERFDALSNGGVDDKNLLEYAISESAVWACTSCGACVDVCPVGNEPMFDILNIRRERVLMESSFPSQLKNAFNGMERNGNPWQMSEDRMAWAKPLAFKVPTVEENPEYEVLYWVGCAGAFDPNAQQIARAIATVLHKAGVNFAVLGNQESCTGDVARRAGNEYLFFEMAKATTETLNGAGADKKTIIAGCPHCLHTLGKEYRDFGARFEVMHHTQFINNLIGSGKIKLDASKTESITFHDPCYLGRHNGEFDAPRNLLSQAGATIEMPRNRSDSFCCGAGGAQVWKEEEHGTQAVNANRFAEAKATGAKTLAIGCPFCARMMNDANNADGATMQVKDVAEIVLEAMG